MSNEYQINYFTEWFVKENDLIGGWCVMDINETPANTKRVPVADFMDELSSIHVASLHNNWLDTLEFGDTSIFDAETLVIPKVKD